MSRRRQTYRILVRESLFHEYEVEAHSHEHAVAKLYKDIDKDGFACLMCIDSNYTVEDVAVVEGGAE